MLKHTLTALRRDPLWESGTPLTGPAPGASIRAAALVVYPANGDAARDFKLVGKLIDEAKAEFDDCSNRCKADQACVALDWGTTTGVCRRYSEVTGSRSPSAQEEVSTVQIKRQ